MSPQEARRRRERREEHVTLRMTVRTRLSVQRAALRQGVSESALLRLAIESGLAALEGQT